jgi:hypothetical protein
VCHLPPPGLCESPLRKTVGRAARGRLGDPLDPTRRSPAPPPPPRVDRVEVTGHREVRLAGEVDRQPHVAHDHVGGLARGVGRGDRGAHRRGLDDRQRLGGRVVGPVGRHHDAGRGQHRPHLGVGVGQLDPIAQPVAGGQLAGGHRLLDLGDPAGQHHQQLAARQRPRRQEHRRRALERGVGDADAAGHGGELEQPSAGPSAAVGPSACGAAGLTRTGTLPSACSGARG